MRTRPSFLEQPSGEIAVRVVDETAVELEFEFGKLEESRIFILSEAFSFNHSTQRRTVEFRVESQIGNVRIYEAAAFNREKLRAIADEPSRTIQGFASQGNVQRRLIVFGGIPERIYPDLLDRKTILIDGHKRFGEKSVRPGNETFVEEFHSDALDSRIHAFNCQVEVSRSREGERRSQVDSRGVRVAHMRKDSETEKFVKDGLVQFSVVAFLDTDLLTEFRILGGDKLIVLKFE